MSAIKKYEENKIYDNHVLDKDKQQAVKTRLRLDDYVKCVDYLDRTTKGNIKTARAFSNMPEILALGMTAYCIRNTCLEDFHAQNLPIDDERMKTFMKECSEKCSEVLANLLSSDYMTRATMMYFLASQCENYCSLWDIPDIMEPSYLENEEM